MERLIPQQEGLGRAGLVNASKGAGIHFIWVTKDGSNNRNYCIEFASCFFTRVDAHRGVEGLLDRSARVGSVLVDVPTGGFNEAGIYLPRQRNEKSCRRLGTPQICGIKLTTLAVKL